LYTWALSLRLEKEGPGLSYGRLAARENGPTHKALSLSHANACNPLLQAHPSALGAGQHEGRGFPLLFSPLCVPSRADPSGLGHVATIYSSVQGPPQGRNIDKERREVCSVKVAAPVYLDWPDKPITFDQGDHPDRVPSPGKYPLVVDPVIGNVRLTKVLMDGGSSLNIVYAKTLGLLQIDLSTIWASAAPFHGIILGKRVQPLGQLDLPVYFGTPSNFRKETLTFEVVGFRGTYHAVLGRPCYAKFMAIPNYTYFKLKMSGPNGVITVGSTYRHTYECDVECVEYAEALAESEALIADLESLSKEVQDVKRHAANFEPAEAVKSVPLDPSNDASKQVRIGSELDPK
jgi:hypothetical protein